MCKKYVMTVVKFESLYLKTSDESKLSWLGLACDIFHFSFKSKIGQKGAEIWLSVEDLFWLIFIIKLYWKWQNYVAKSYHSTLKKPFVLISSDKWSWNWLESWYRSKIGKFDIHIVSSVSARKLKCPSSAWLDSTREISARTHHY